MPRISRLGSSRRLPTAMPRPRRCRGALVKWAIGGVTAGPFLPGAVMAIAVDTVRRVASLAQIREPEARLAALAGELSAILGWIEQLNEVDPGGVEPMTSAVAVPMPMREDI